MLPFHPRHFGVGVIISQLTPAQSLAAIAHGDIVAHGRENPIYVDRPMFQVVLNNGGQAKATLPTGLSARVGDRVAVQDGFRSPDAACRYNPTLVVDDFGPAPAQQPALDKPQ